MPPTLAAESSAVAGATPARPAAAPASALARVASLTYGVAAYTLFLGTFLYMIGFVTGLVVPVTVHDGRPGPLTQALLVNGGFLALFAVQHTIMARRGFKRWWTRIVPAQIERSTFVLVTSLILLGMVWQWRQLPGTLWAVQGPAALFLQGVSFLGFGLVLISTFLIDHFELFGLKQVVRYFRGLPATPPPFVERWLYGKLRHPLMLGFLVAFWATPVMSMGHLFFTVMTTGYILVGIQIEERSLVAEHGETYREYRRRVPALLPIRR